MTRLQAAFAAELAAIGEFLPHLKREEKALIDGDTDLLAKIVSENTEKVVKMAEITAQRELLMKSLGLTADLAGIEMWLKKHPEGRKTWEELHRLSSEARNINETIGTLIDLRMRQNQQAISILELAANKNSSLYGPDGFSSGNRGGRGFISA